MGQRPSEREGIRTRLLRVLRLHGTDEFVSPAIPEQRRKPAALEAAEQRSFTAAGPEEF